MKTILALLLALTPPAAVAGTSSALAPAQDAQAECRSFAEVCARAESAKASMESTTATLEELNARGDSWSDADAAKVASLAAQARSAAATYVRAAKEVTDLSTALRAKYTPPPACLACAALD